MVKTESIYRWLESVVASHDNKPALAFLRDGSPETEMSYSRLLRDVNRFANTLLDRGVRKGDRVILFLPKSLVAVVAHFALQAVGAMAVPLNPGFKKNEMTYLLGDADARLIIVDAGKKELIRDIDPNAELLITETAKPYHEIDFFRSAPETSPMIDVCSGDPGWSFILPEPPAIPKERF